MEIAYKEYKNGNITIKASELNTDNFFDIICNIANNIDMIDTYLITDYPYNVGNDCIAVDFYNVRLDKIYSINSYQVSKYLLNNKVLRMIARTPDLYERENIKAWEG